ncbi:hypothetical protein [Bacillus thuringiensis]|uniref:hypothetical protein n=1 Tax=Bacillus thuringiensis TaxID=1428 RepID=UPI000BFB901F|nr:hypothetical protein [Bacillus thuringiensis]MCU4818848.1 hypothetical protein [Bacillus cereus]MCU4896617.1 hypothetical protein [Bacillus cereus]PGM52869.1 hypothetical protein CN949_08935 [Bacillus thuringiensis]PGV72259.1 hypothetical protein COD83_26625 [Bacillus thuringiensis]
MNSNERENFKSLLQKELLTTSQAAELLGISKQRFGVITKKNTLTPIHESSQGKLFLRRDIEKIVKGLHKPSKDLDRILVQPYGSSDEALLFFEENKEFLDEITSIYIYQYELDAVLDNFYIGLDTGFENKQSLDVPHLVLRDDLSGKELWFKSLNCGYSGQGPRCTIKLLTRLGIDSDYAASLITEHKIVKFFKSEDNNFEGTFENAIVDGKESQGIAWHTWNNKLIFSQKGNYTFEFDNQNTLLFLKDYYSIIPNIKDIIIFNSKEEALEKGYYTRDYKNNEIIHQLIIRDISNRELWLRIPRTPNDIPLKHHKDVKELLAMCGINIEEPTDGFPEIIKRWLNIRPRIQPSEILTRESQNIVF